MDRQYMKEQLCEHCRKTKRCADCVLKQYTWKYPISIGCLDLDKSDIDELERALNYIEIHSNIENKKENDVVHHPAHYCYSEYEPKDVIRSWGLNFNLGNVVKYVARAGRKDDILQELNKAKQYLEFEIAAIEKEHTLDK